MASIGKIIGVNGNLIRVKFETAVSQNEVAYAKLTQKNKDGKSEVIPLKSEVIRIRGDYAELQVFEDTTGLKTGDEVEFTGELLSVELGPGLLTQVFDGLQNPLPKLAEECGFFLQRGKYLKALPRDKKWAFTPVAKVGDVVVAGDTHRIMVPFRLLGKWTVESVSAAGELTVETVVAKLKNDKGETQDVTMVQTWPVKMPIKAFEERLRPSKPLTMQQRIIDTFFPVMQGGTFCTPGPFGAGKTVLQQLMSRYADVDIVILAACGERAGEVVETLREFPELIDPRTGKSLMERTLIICNTSSMPVAAREASVYTGVTLAEYYRQMGLNVLLLADSTSRWAQALREMSGRLEEIPGEEAFPAYLESVIAAFYERGGVVRLKDGSTGSVTICGSVSPAGGNFEEPVILANGVDVNNMMKVVGEEGTSIDDFVIYLKSEYLDAVYLQQDAYNEIDAACSAERQKYVFDKVYTILKTPMKFSEKDVARTFFLKLTQSTKDWNRVKFDSQEFKDLEQSIFASVKEVSANA